ncbi:MAG: dipicolinate synthase subunit B [Bacillota bacterium]|nr:dipicolinate synthase subunit B [Bacillota bacterium]
MCEWLRGLRVGFALCGSHCTLDRAFTALELLRERGALIYPLISASVRYTDSRFGEAAARYERLRALSADSHVIDSIEAAEPIGPKRLFDILLIAPLTGNSCAKLAAGIADTPVTMAAKAHLRGQRPLLLAISSNDALAANAKNIGALLNYKHIFFLPFYQDDPLHKPNSLVSDYTALLPAMQAALQGRQYQPLLAAPPIPPV